MQALNTLLALLLPALCGAACLSLFVPRYMPARAFTVWGCGALLSLIALPQFMRLMDAKGLPLTFAAIASALLILTLLALAVGLWVRRGGVQAPAQTAPPGRAETVLLAIIVALIGLRLITLGIEVGFRPLFPWDATMHWATKARVWYEHQAIVPFVSTDAWLELGGQGVYTDRHPHYPQVIPLLQVWMNLGYGAWNESLMNLPWLLCFAALGAAFYGQLRLAGLSVTLSAIVSYLLMSMPLLNIHVALAGYADLFLGATYGCAVMCLHNWMRYRQGWLAILTLLFGIACPLIKNEGFIWSLTLVPAVMVAFMQRRQAAKFFLLCVLGGFFFLLILPEEFEVGGYSVSALAPVFNPGALRGIVYSAWVHASWHMFAYLLLIVIPLGIVMPGAMTKTYLGVTTSVASSVAAYLVLFLFTGFGVGAADYAAVGRLSIQLAPALMFLGALLYNELLHREYFWKAPDA